MRIAILNGPNLNLLGIREPELYGSAGLSEINNALIREFPKLDLDFFQSNIEGEIVSHIQSLRGKAAYIVLNAGAYTHTSIAILDALRAVNIPFVEVHISNIYAREPFRRHSLLAPYALAQLSGFGIKGYSMALNFLSEKVERG